LKLFRLCQTLGESSLLLCKLIRQVSLLGFEGLVPGLLFRKLGLLFSKFFLLAQSQVFGILVI